MAKASNLRNVQKYPDGAYNCTIDLDMGNGRPVEIGCVYIARDGDYAPVNLWILDEIKTGNYQITDFQMPSSAKT